MFQAFGELLSSREENDAMGGLGPERELLPAYHFEVAAGEVFMTHISFGTIYSKAGVYYGSIQSFLRKKTTFILRH